MSVEKDRTRLLVEKAFKDLTKEILKRNKEDPDRTLEIIQWYANMIEVMIHKPDKSDTKKKRELKRKKKKKETDVSVKSKECDASDAKEPQEKKDPSNLSLA